MEKLFTGFLLIVCSFTSWAQHFGFSQEISSYVPAGANEVQLNVLTATLGKNKVNGDLMVASLDQVVIVNEANGKVISRFGGDGNFSNVQAITTDSQGNYYITDVSDKVVKYDANGNYVISWGTFGSANGQFSSPIGICTDDDNNVYVVDNGNNRIQKFDAQGNFIAKWGNAGSGDGQFSSPYGIAYWPSLGSLIVADANNSRIQGFGKDGAFSFKTALTASPYSLDVDLINNKLLVLAQGKIFQFDNNLAAPLATWGPNGVGGANANFVNSLSIAVSSYSSPSAFSRLFVVENFKLVSYYLGGANNGTIADNYGIDGTSIGQFNNPVSADYPKFNVSNLYTLDRGRYNSGTQLFASGLSKRTSTGTSTKTSYSLSIPTDVIVGTNFQYILDRINVPTPSNHLEVHKFDLNNGFVGKISIGLINPTGMTMDAADNFYFTKQNGSVSQIYKFDNTGVAGISWNTTSSINQTPKLATDASNNLYISNGYNSILKYNGTTGALMNTFGGVGAFADGELHNILSIDVDGSGKIYVLEDDRFQIFDASFTFLQRVDLVAGIQPGRVNQPFLIRADYTGANIAILDRNSDRVQFFVIKLDQTINFSALPVITIGTPAFALTATGGASGNTVTYTSSNLSVAYLSGNTVFVNNPGTTIITASQAGNGTYNPALSVPQTLTVTKLSQTIPFNALPNKIFGDLPFALTPTTGGSPGSVVTFASSNLSVATISGSTVTIVGAGTSLITASLVADATYDAAADVQQSLTVTKASQTITFSALPAKTAVDAAFTLGGVASSAIAVTYTSSNLAVATISGNTLTIVGSGTSNIIASQAGNSSYNAAPDVPQPLTVTKASQTITFNSLPLKNIGDAAFTLSATGGTSGNAITYASSNLAVATVAGNSVTIVGAGSTTITASQVGNAKYNAAADVPQTLTVVSKQNQTIAFNSLPAITFGTTAFTLTATASSGLAASYSTLDDEVTIANSQVTIVKPGFVTINADQSGNAAFNAAPQVQRGFCINPVKPTITESLNNTASPLLTSSSTAGNQWFLNGVAITGATNNAYSVTQVGSYTVQVKAETCVSAVSDAFAIVVTALEDSEVISVSCSPNPANDFITINAPTNTGASAKVFIYSMSGQLMVSGGAENLNEPIRVSHYASGIYIAHVIINQKKSIQKFIKK